MTPEKRRQIYLAHETQVEDFWGRRVNEPRIGREFEIFGRQCRVVANDEHALAAVDVALPHYSHVPSQPGGAFEIQIVVGRAGAQLEPPVESVPDYLAYTGQGSWIQIDAGPFGSAWADLNVGEAKVVVVPALAERPDLLARCFLNTLLLNFCLAAGYAMLHASCLVRDGRALLLMAPHNTGKSTTALRLTLNGFTLVSDSMIHIVPEMPRPRRLLLAGFPVRRIKLRSDMAPLFAKIGGVLTTEQVRGEVKQVLDLEQIDPSLVATDAVRPELVTLCLLSRGTGDDTRWEPAPAEDVWPAVIENSLYHDAWPVWKHNLDLVDQLLSDATCVRLEIGRDPEKLLRQVEALWAYGAG